MPRIDGLALVRAVQPGRAPQGTAGGAGELAGLCRSSAPQGSRPGADAYLSKGEFEQGLLLATLARFV